MKSIAIVILGFALSTISVAVPIILAIRAGELSLYGAIALIVVNVAGFGMFWYWVTYGDDL